jgi:hypothetical protein
LYFIFFFSILDLIFWKNVYGGVRGGFAK